MFKKMVVLTILGLSVAVLPLFAQEPATLVLKNGQRISGELIDLNASGFALRVNGQEQHYAPSDVAVVEFQGGEVPGDARNKLNAGQPVVVLRSGQTVDGRLSDVGGTRPLRLTIDTPSGLQRDFTSNDVARIYFSNPGGAGPTSGQAAQVPANQQWTATDIVVARGERVQFNSSGDIMVAQEASSGVGGSPINPGGRLPVLSAGVGALIGRVGNGTPFLIGANASPIPMPANGRLMLGINDDHVADNTGNFTVQISRMGR